MRMDGTILDAENETTGLPAFPTWRAVYGFVVGFFLVVITLMVILERTFQ